MASEESLRHLRASIKEATRPIVVQLTNVERKIDDVADIVRPIPAQIVKLDTQVEGLTGYKASHEMKIIGLTGKMQNIELTLARVAPQPKPFWEGPNAKYALMLALTLTSGLVGLAGYKIGNP